MCTGVRMKVSAQNKVLDSRNKQELISFLTECLLHAEVPEGNAIFIYQVSSR